MFTFWPAGRRKARTFKHTGSHGSVITLEGWLSHSSGTTEALGRRRMSPRRSPRTIKRNRQSLRCLLGTSRSLWVRCSRCCVLRSICHCCVSPLVYAPPSTYMFDVCSCLPLASGMISGIYPSFPARLHAYNNGLWRESMCVRRIRFLLCSWHDKIGRVDMLTRRLTAARAAVATGA